MKKSHGFTSVIQGFILATEGGYSDHPKDPGGATNYGITISTLSAWRKRKVSKAEVKALTKNEALEIYKANYWDVMQCSDLPLGTDYMVMDYGVNSGPAKAIKDLQRVVGAFDDGALGTKTLAAIDRFIERNGIQKLLEEYANIRWNFMKGLSVFKTFKNGWRTRVWGKNDGLQTTDTGVVDRALKIATGADTTKIPAPEPVVGAAIPERPGAVEMLKDPTTLTGIAGAFATVVGAVQNQPVLQFAAVVAIVVVVGFYLYQRRQANPT